jgi:hypothetical protein
LPAFVVVCVIDDSRSDWNEVESQCSFDLHSFIAEDVEHFFIYLLVICISIFENCLFGSFVHIFSGFWII